jgi:hypothetical protein
LAAAGDAEAQYRLGVMYGNGEAVQQDFSEAANWFRRAAELGLAEAQYNLGVMVFEGRGVRQDYAEALIWLGKAAEQGLSDAQHNIGVIHERGYGVEQDYTEAVRWYRRAAEQGYAPAQCNLGGMYAQGRGVPPDPTEAGEWYTRAAYQGDALAQRSLAAMYTEGHGVPQDYTEAAKWLYMTRGPRPSPLRKHSHVMIVGAVAYGAVETLRRLFPSQSSNLRFRLENIPSIAADYTVAFVCIAAVCLIAALIFGTYRHLWLDASMRGIPFDLYLGGVRPVPRGLLRVASWLLVGITSLVSGVLLISLVSPIDLRTSEIAWVTSVGVVIYLRWLISVLIAWVWPVGGP